MRPISMIFVGPRWTQQSAWLQEFESSIKIPRGANEIAVHEKPGRLNRFPIGSDQVEALNHLAGTIELQDLSLRSHPERLGVLVESGSRQDSNNAVIPGFLVLLIFYLGCCQDSFRYLPSVQVPLGGQRSVRLELQIIGVSM
jgi:hypothetical protein